MICTQEDQYTRERWLTHARWVATLSSGLEVIQDDDRPGLAEPSAWLRLAEYLQGKNISLIALRFGFRNGHHVHLPERQRGYFFRKGVGANLLARKSVNYFLVGHLEGESVQVWKYRVPEVVLVGKEVRDALDEKLVGPSLIRSA